MPLYIQLKDFDTAFFNNHLKFYGILRPRISFEKIILYLLST